MLNNTFVLAFLFLTYQEQPKWAKAALSYRNPYGEMRVPEWQTVTVWLLWKNLRKLNPPPSTCALLMPFSKIKQYPLSPLDGGIHKLQDRQKAQPFSLTQDHSNVMIMKTFAGPRNVSEKNLRRNQTESHMTALYI